MKTESQLQQDVTAELKWEGAVVVGGLSALGAALTQIGVPKDQVIQYEAALKVDKYLLVVHGSQELQAEAGRVLAQAKQAVAA